MSKTIFTEGNPVAGIPATVVTAAFMNALQVHRHDGLDSDGSAPVSYGLDSGSANNYLLTLTPSLSQYIPGMPVRFKAGSTNTGASTIDIDGIGVKALTLPSGSALYPSAIRSGQIVECVYDGSAFQLANWPLGELSLESDAGYCRLPGGLLVQWKRAPFVGVPGDSWESNRGMSVGPIAFPLAFSTPPLVFAIAQEDPASPSNPEGSEMSVGVISVEASQATFSVIRVAGTDVSGLESGFIQILALGY